MSAEAGALWRRMMSAYFTGKARATSCSSCSSTNMRETCAAARAWRNGSRMLSTSSFRNSFKTKRKLISECTRNRFSAALPYRMMEQRFVPKALRAVAKKLSTISAWGSFRPISTNIEENCSIVVPLISRSYVYYKTNALAGMIIFILDYYNKFSRIFFSHINQFFQTQSKNIFLQFECLIL